MRCGAEVTRPAVRRAKDPATSIPTDVLQDLHRRMVRIRLFEEEAGKLMEGGRMPGFLHLYVGQEAVAAG
jgi:acetoin:2,6-dichlorophenolindophenol oxidoreductase subunit alpha